MKARSMIFVIALSLLMAFAGGALLAESPNQWAVGYDGLDANTVSLWHADEGAGSSAADVKGIKPFTDFYGNYPTWVTGRFGTALGFNGTSTAAYAFGPNPGYAFGTQPFTVECWLNPANQGGSPFILDNTGNWSLRRGATANSLEAYIGDLDTGISITSGAVLIPNAWQHVAMTSGGPGGKLRLWVNGNVVAETNISATAAVNGASSPQITMGRWTFGGAYYFDGAVDEVRISNIERSFAPMADGTISGHVYAPDGISPLADVEVKVSGTSNKDYTDSQGFYSLTTNAPAVVVEAYYPHHNLGTATVSVISNQTTTQNFTLTERPAESATQWMLGYAGLEDDPDTLSLWHFDEGTGSTGVDSKGVCSFTNPYGSFPYWIDGKFGKALDFDGWNTCAFAFYSNKEYAFGTHAFTVEAWIMPRAGVDQVPNAELVDNTQFWALRYGSGLNSLEGIVGETDPDLLFDTGSGLMTPGEWQHVAVTYGGPGGKLRLWRNGKVVFQTTVDPSTVVNLDRSSPQITLGRSTYMGAYYFDGLIDEVRISRVEREFGPTGGVVCATIGDAKKQVPNTVVSITNPQVVTATFGVDYGGPYYYVEDQNRSNGIRVWGQNAFYRGDTVLVQGTLQLVNGEMTLSQDSVQLQDPVDPLGPLGMNGRAIGGGESGLQPAVSQGIGLNTIGLLVRTTGVVRGANYPTFYVDDGSGAIGTDGVQGVKVFSLDAFPSDGQHAIVAGVCSAESVNGIIRPVIITRPNDSSFPNDVVAF